MSAIYEPKGRAREYSPLALNYFKGCDHGCVYCYVPPMMKRFRTGYEHSNVIIDIDYNAIESSAKKFQGCGKQILFSFTTDPYTVLENGETRKVLEILNKYKHKVAILTKSGSKVMKDIDTFKSFGDRIKVGQSLTFDNDIDSFKWEPGAAMPSDRVFAIEYLASEGIKTWASFEPTIIPEQSINLLSQVSKFIDHVRIGKINNFNGIDKDINWYSYIKKSVYICRSNDIKFYIKDDLAVFSKDIYLTENERNKDFLNL